VRERGDAARDHDTPCGQPVTVAEIERELLAVPVQPDDPPPVDVWCHL
jgi:hypothetical protein